MSVLAILRQLVSLRLAPECSQKLVLMEVAVGVGAPVH
jgi:hypothetical protein